MLAYYLYTISTLIMDIVDIKAIYVNHSHFAKSKSKIIVFYDYIALQLLTATHGKMYGTIQQCGIKIYHGILQILSVVVEKATAPTLNPVLDERLLVEFKFAKLRVLAVESLTIKRSEPVYAFLNELAV